jgi:aspartate-semialdehyde dehydrogenase
LPSSPKTFLAYIEGDDRPQTRLDRDAENGMGITLGRLREDNIFDYKFIALSHNTVRGAAGGAVLMAELLTREGYIKN